MQGGTEKIERKNQKKSLEGSSKKGKKNEKRDVTKRGGFSQAERQLVFR